MSPNDREDQEFDDFLQGKGELAQQLKSLPQPQPPDVLTQAILARAQSELGRPAAANAASFSGTARPGWISRMRVPLTLAASLMLGIATAILWRDNVTPETPVTAQATPPAATDKPEQVAAAGAPAAPVAPAGPAGPATPSSTAPAHPPAGSTPPVVVAQADPSPITDNSVVMRSVPTPETGPDTPPQAWLSIIATLIQQDKRAEALAQWDKFRKAYPQYEVPEAVQAHIDALKK